MSIASRIGSALPGPLRRGLRPFWYRAQLYGRYFARGGRLWFDTELLTVAVSKPIMSKGGDHRIAAVARSPRELRRWMGFGSGADDPTFDWLCGLTSDDCLWSIGASNGLEGLLAHSVGECDVVFVEPFTPSIESLLKSLFLNRKLGRWKKAGAILEVVQAGVDEKPAYDRFLCHTKPVPGETLNSAETGADSYCQGGRSNHPVSSTQWTKFVSLDELHFEHGLKPPTHLMIDVDGFEVRVLKGGTRLLTLPELREIVIEVNDGNGPVVDKILHEAGFERLSEHVHHRSETVFTADYIYRRAETAGNA